MSNKTVQRIVTNLSFKPERVLMHKPFLWEGEEKYEGMTLKAIYAKKGVDRRFYVFFTETGWREIELTLLNELLVHVGLLPRHTSPRAQIFTRARPIFETVCVTTLRGQRRKLRVPYPDTALPWHGSRNTSHPQFGPCTLTGLYPQLGGTGRFFGRYVRSSEEHTYNPEWVELTQGQYNEERGQVWPV